MHKRFCLFCALTVLFALSATAQPKRAAPPAPARVFTAQQLAESGTFSEGVYRNELLRFSMSVPQEWDVFSEEFNKSVLAKGRDSIASKTTGVKQSDLDRSIANTKVLFTAATRTSAGDAMLVVGVEIPPVGMTRDIYARQNRDLVLKMMSGSVVKKGLHERMFGGLAFSAFELEAPKPAGTMKQVYFVTARGGNIVFAVATFWDHEQRGLLENALETLNFGK